MEFERLTIRDLPVEERPRERLAKFGAQALSNAELLALILRTGTTEETVIDVALKLLKKSDGNLVSLFSSSLNELQETNGIGLAKAAQIQACFELGKRFATIKQNNGGVVRNDEDVAELLIPQMRFLDKEVFKVVMLDSRNKIIKIQDISVGTLNASLVHPREVFKVALKESAASIILVHNHPSGDPTPSTADIEMTKTLVSLGRVMDILVLDHIIIGGDQSVSLERQGIIPKQKPC